jgi:hypothetical protein
MTRSLFISACGDPFILLFTLKLWKERWRDEVTNVWICLNNHVGVSQSVIGELLQRISQDKMVHIIYVPHGVGNGRPIELMAQASTDDLCVLFEDDSFMFTFGEIDSAFKQIENGHVDAIGSPRGSCGEEVWKYAGIKYNLDYSGIGDKGPTFWPSFFYCKREDLLKTDHNFASKEYTAGTYFKEIDHTIEKTEYSDTFAWTSLQLRYMGMRIGEIPQNHANPFDILYESQGTNLWKSPKAKWIHGGSLSAGLSGYLSGQVPDVSTDGAKQEIESRVAFWDIVSCDEIRNGAFDSFNREYRDGIYTLEENAHLNTDRIEKKIQIYRQLMQV